jgi:hypothetical protein
MIIPYLSDDATPVDRGGDCGILRKTDKRRKESMSYAKAVLLIGIVLCILWLAVASAAHAGNYEDARSVRDTHSRVTRLANELREARHVEGATRYYSTHDYSDFAGRTVAPVPVGRWVWLARDVGWQWSQIDMLMHIIARESSGSPTVTNTQGSGATGLLQLMPGWYAGDYYNFPDFNPKDARLNLYYGHKGYEESGWAPWQL